MTHKEEYTVRVDAMVPVSMTYKVIAESPEEAIKIAEIHGKAPMYEPPKLSYTKMRKIKAQVYDFGTIMLKLSKQY